MCGILGFMGNYEPYRLNVGLSAISHRGPDDSGVFFDENSSVGLGHVRLSILDLSPSGHQPMASADGRVVIVYNGEIYNFHELRKDLVGKGYHFHSHSDTEVLLNLYLTNGVAMLAMLKGIFAFAIWDSRCKSLLLVRDGLGVKPLYYNATDRGVAFASEIKGLMSMVPVSHELDTAALHRYLSFLWCPGEGTPLKMIRKLLPGEAIIVCEGIIKQRWNWYQLPVVDRDCGVFDLADSEIISRTAEELKKAVNRQLVADVPVGAFLSGGLDSSSVVAFAREQMSNIRCFTIDPVGEHETGMSDDLSYAKKVAKYLDVPLDIIRIDANGMADDLEYMVKQLDEPLADPAPLNVLYICRLAREQGIKVLLSGAGGDDIFTGYRRHFAVKYEHFWRWIPAGARRMLENVTCKLDQRNHFFRRTAKLFNGAGLDGDEHLAAYFAWTREADLFSLYTPEFRASLGQMKACAPMIEFLQSLPSTVSPLDRMLALEQRFFLADHNLIYTDKMSMAVGVEVRVPFLDLDLVKFASRIPVNLKQHGREGKWVLKKAMEPYLPHEVIYRPKSGFGAPLRRWMRHELRPLLGDMLSPESLKKRGIFDPAAVQLLIQRNDTGQTDAAYTLLSILCIEIWCRSFLNDIP